MVSGEELAGDGVGVALERVLKHCLQGSSGLLGYYQLTGLRTVLTTPAFWESREGKVFESVACVLKLEETLKRRDKCRDGYGWGWRVAVTSNLGVHICGSKTLELSWCSKASHLMN